LKEEVSFKDGDEVFLNYGAQDLDTDDFLVVNLVGKASQDE
jgi:hypothetical protein